MASPPANRRPTSVVAPPKHPEQATGLTPREHEVVALGREGASTRDIARRLGVRSRTVDALLRDARCKLAATQPSHHGARETALGGGLARLLSFVGRRGHRRRRRPSRRASLAERTTASVAAPTSTTGPKSGVSSRLPLIVALLAAGAAVVASSGTAIAEQAGAPPVGSDRVVAGRIDSGPLHTRAIIDNGSVRCWGVGTWGQLGYGNMSPVGDNETPAAAGRVAVGPGRTAITVTSGGSQTCVVLDDGTVRCWGRNTEGQLGYADTTEDIGDDETPATAGPVDLGGRTAIAVTAGDFHSCALLEFGQVSCWGGNDHGQLGYGGEATVGATPGSFEVGLGIGRTATAVTAGSNHTCAVLDDGTVRCWGDNDEGQLGYADTTEDIGDDEIPAAAGPIDLAGRTAIAIAAGYHHTCALLEFGQVSCWGGNDHGQLGYGGEATVGATPGSFEVGLGVGRNATAITAGGFHTCAVLDDGTARCWGEAEEGQLGYGNTDDIGDDEIPAGAGPVDIGTRALTAITAGSDTTCGVLDNGRVRCWGSGSNGKLGCACNPGNIGDDETPPSIGPLALGGLVRS